MKISDYLARGAKGARTARELRELLHMSDYELRNAIHHERLNGVPICSRTYTDDAGRAGFYMPESSTDYMLTIRHLRSREKEIRIVRTALEKAYKDRYGK